MAIKNGLLKDENGNILHPQTSINQVVNVSGSKWKQEPPIEEIGDLISITKQDNKLYLYKGELYYAITSGGFTQKYIGELQSQYVDFFGLANNIIYIIRETNLYEIDTTTDTLVTNTIDITYGCLGNTMYKENLYGFSTNSAYKFDIKSKTKTTIPFTITIGSVQSAILIKNIFYLFKNDDCYEFNPETTETKLIGKIENCNFYNSNIQFAYGDKGVGVGNMGLMYYNPKTLEGEILLSNVVFSTYDLYTLYKNEIINFTKGYAINLKTRKMRFFDTTSIYNKRQCGVINVGDKCYLFGGGDAYDRSKSVNKVDLKQAIKIKKITSTDVE